MPEEHYFIASELTRLGVKWVSLAPRLPGRFEKGIEYIGDLADFRRQFARHVAVMRTLGPYKLSIHSGSDKFSIYPIIAELAGGLVHLKTAGTSYVEALRAVAVADPALFREILTFAAGRYETDKASYLVSADVSLIPAVSDKESDAKCDPGLRSTEAAPAKDGHALTRRPGFAIGSPGKRVRAWHPFIPDIALPALLDDPNVRQVLHVTFGSVLQAGAGQTFRDPILAAISRSEETFYDLLSSHIRRHIQPFAR
jgi:hypothetical protein